MECSGVNVTFDTTNQIAKSWFYPRYMGGELHEPAFTYRLLESLHQDSVFYDIGANVGYFTLFASEVCIDGEVHSFELDSKFVDSIKASLQKNGTSAVINQKAVSSESGNTIRYTDSAAPSVTDQQSNANESETITIDEYQRTHAAPDVMKVDVEGFEYEVLLGAKNTLNDTDITVLFVEIHPDLLNQYGHDKYDVFTLLDDMDFKIRELEDHRSQNPSGLHSSDPDEIMSNTMLECRL
ncbi:FkbM family methyltransferase [Haloarcula marina]|uniref:FkbM family methyltransferase n=1 Tax=Haloarcula marina TaxID=2961574 RepID=UPI0020B7A374|nr:FkbM family methyltransferase [Halomicroarcula marina]